MIAPGSPKRYQPHEAIETGVFGASVKLLDRRNDAVHSLNPSAAAVWLVLDVSPTRAQIVADLADLVGGSVPQIESVVDETLEQFWTLGLLVGATEPETTQGFQLVSEYINDLEVVPRPPEP